MKFVIFSTLVLNIYLFTSQVYCQTNTTDSLTTTTTNLAATNETTAAAKSTSTATTGTTITTKTSTTTTTTTTTTPPNPHSYACLSNSAWHYDSSVLYCFHGGNRGLLNTNDEGWDKVETICQSLHWRSHLAYITSAAIATAYQSYRDSINYDNVELWISCYWSSNLTAYAWAPLKTAITYTPPAGPPSGNDKYCYWNEKTGYEWRTDDDIDQQRQYICMMPAVPVINAVELTLSASPALIATGANWALTFPATYWGSDLTSVYITKYSDGTNTTSYYTMPWYKTFPTAGVYWTTATYVSNAVSGPYTITTMLTVVVFQKCKIFSASVTTAVLGNSSDFTITVDSGTNCSLLIDYQDGNTALFTYPGNVTDCVAPDPNCPTASGKWVIKVSHLYAAPGAYSVKFFSENPVSNSSYTAIAYVQSIVQNFVIISPTTFNYYPYGSNYIVEFGASNGSNLQFTITVDNADLSGTEFWDPVLRYGNVTVPFSVLNGQVGAKTLSITAVNFVSSPTTVVYSCQFEYMFNSFTYTPNPMHLTADKIYNLRFTWANASHFNYTIDMGNGNPLAQYSKPLDVIENYTPKEIYTPFVYPQDGHYVLTIHAVNHVDSKTYTINVTVEYPICCASLVTDYVGVMLHAGGPGVPGVFSLIWNNLTQPYPTNAVYDFDFGESGGTLTGTPYLAQQNQTQSYTYINYGVYTVNVTIHNLVSSVFFTTTVYIVVGFQGVTFDMIRLNPNIGTEKHDYYLITNEVAEFVVNMQEGSNFNLTINWEDSSPSSPYIMSSTHAGNVARNHSCPQAGWYNVSMLIQNAAQYEAHLLPVPRAPRFLVVQDPIQCFQTQVLPSNALTIYFATQANGAPMQLQINTNSSCLTQYGTNPRYKVDWDDGTPMATGGMPGYNALLSHTYTNSNIYNVEVTVWNEVSFQTFVETVQVYNEVYQVSIVPMYIDSSNKEQHSPLQTPPSPADPTLVYFGLESTVVFHANKVFGTYEQYIWTFNDGYDPGTNATIYRDFTDTGTYTLTLRIKNQPTLGTTSLTIIIERRTNNLVISDNSPWPRYVEPYQSYQISIGSVATDACYFMDFIDTSPDAECRYLFWGNEQTCQEKFPNFPGPGVHCPQYKAFNSHTFDFGSLSFLSNPTSILNDTTTTIGFHHKFNTLGRKHVSLRVVNHVDDKTFYYDSYVTKGWCNFPKVIVRDLNRCLTSDKCKCFQSQGPQYICGQSDYTDGDRVAYIKDQLLLDADVSINCSSSPNVWFNWTLQELDAQGKVKYNSSYRLNGLNYQSYSSKILVVPPRYLPGGRYHFTLKVSPAEEVDMDRSDDTFIWVDASFLIANFYGNLSGLHVESNKQVTFDAYTESYDPDAGRANKTGLTFSFFCRRTCESWPTPGPSQVYTDWGVYNTSACLPADGSQRGCFNNGPQALTLPSTTSQWSQGDNSGTIVINTGAMQTKLWYTLLVIVRKDSRMAYKEIMFYISDKKVPVVYFSCVTNCQSAFSPLPTTISGRTYQRVNPTSRFSIEAIVEGFSMSTSYFYKWDLISRPKDKHDNVFTPKSLPIVNDEDWLFKASTGRDIRTMCVEENLWNSTFQYAGFFLRMQFAIGDPTGPAGEFWFEFFLNEPPEQKSARCWADGNPMSMDASYGIACSGYQDLEGGDLYYFVKQMDMFTPDYWLDIGNSKTSMMSNGIIPVNPAAGLEENGFNAAYKVRIIDSAGSYRETQFIETVDPFDITYDSYGTHPVWSILNYTANCAGCRLEDFFTLLSKQQRLPNVTSVTRTFSTMLNTNPSDGCIIVPCDNSTANCTEIEMAATTMAPKPIPDDIQPLITKWMGPSWLTLSTCQLDLQLRIKLRERMLDMFKNLQIPYFSYFSQVLGALYTATFSPPENTIQMMEAVEYCLTQGIMNIDGVDPQMAIALEADIREEACLSVTGIVANMEQTANYFGKIWRDELIKYYPQFTMENLVDQIKAAEGGANVTDDSEIWQLSNDTLIDNTTMEHLSVVRNNITLIHVVLFKIEKLKQNITSYVQARKVMGEAPSRLSTENLTAVFVKSAVKNMTGFPIAVSGGCNFYTGDATEMFGDTSTLQEETIQAAGECSKNNPFVTDPSSKGLGGTVTLSFQNSLGTVPVGNLSKQIDAFVPRELNTSFVEPVWNATQPFSNAMFVYSFGIMKHQGLTILLYEGFWKELGQVSENATNITMDYNASTPISLTTKHSVNFNISDSDNTDSLAETQFVIFIKYWKTFETDDKYDDYCLIPKWPLGSVNLTENPTWGDRRACTISYKSAMENVPKDIKPTGEAANIYVSIQSIPDGKTFDNFQKTTKIKDFNSKDFVSIDYTLFSVMSSCKYYDDESKVWRDDGTDIGKNTSLGVTHCLTTHLTSFASGFSLPMNDLNLQDSGFLHLAENPIAFVFCCCMFCLYLILLVWCRRKDKEDVMKAGIAPLPDNDPLDKYLYQVVFYTGSRPNSGTTSRIFFQLTGEVNETDVRLAEDSRRAAFRRNGIDTFIMATPQSLGKMAHLRIWHDNSGKSPSWYFSRFQVLDVQTGEQFFFVVDNWLAVEEGDGQVERLVPVAGKNDLTDFNQLFFQKSQKSLFDGHIWFSVFRRPPRSSFTRVQRLTCCLSLIYCTMVANILFYGQKTDEGSVILSVGPITFTWTSMLVAIVSGLIVVPVNTALVLIFRYSKPPPPKTPMKQYQEQLKYQDKQTKKEQKRLMKQMKDEQRKKMKNNGTVDPALVHADIDGHEDATDEVPYVADQPKLGPDVKVVPEPPKVVRIDTRARKKRFLLPHWFIYVGYVLAFATVAVGFWLIVQVAFGFGRTKALSWVIAMFVSLIQSIIFVQPIKIIFLAVVYSCLCKKPEKDEYEPEEIELLENEVYLHETSTAADMSDIEKRRQIANQLRRTRNALPPELQALQSARERRLKELAMWALIKEIIYYALFLYTLMMVAYGERDQLSYQMVKNGQRLFVSGGGNKLLKNSAFNIIKTPNHFYSWAENIFLPALFPSSDYRNQSIPAEGYVWDGKGYLAGTVRFRQLRIKQNSCKVPKLLQTVINHCRDSYSVLDEDKDDYHRKWVPMNASIPSDHPDDKWTYQSMSDTKSDIVIALISTYWGGGYVADLGNNSVSAYKAYYDLKASDWVDSATRAIFVEFTLAYPSVNMLLISELVVEFMSTGGAVSSTGFGVLRINPYDGPTTVPIIIGEVCCLIFLIYFLYREIRHLMKQKKKYFLDFWNWLEMIVIALMITALVMYAYRMLIRDKMKTSYIANPHSFNSFASPLFWEQVYSWMIYIVLFIANVKFLRILRFNRRITMIVDTMYYGWKYMVAFMSTFMLVFMAFASAAFMMFGTRVLDFMSFLNTLEALWVIMLNKFDFSDFHDSNAVFGPIFFVLFTLILNFILVNMFLSIVNDSFAVSKHDGSSKNNQYELVDFMWFKLKSAFCGVNSSVEHMDGPGYTELQDTVERDLRDCDEKIEEMVIRMQYIFKEEKLDEKLKSDWRYKGVEQNEGVGKRHVIVSD